MHGVFLDGELVVVTARETWATQIRLLLELRTPGVLPPLEVRPVSLTEIAFWEAAVKRADPPPRSYT